VVVEVRVNPFAAGVGYIPNYSFSWDKIPKQLFSRNGPVAASPCKGMGQWQLTNPAKGKFASKKCSNMF
jgi:hypothetical protein